MVNVGRSIFYKIAGVSGLIAVAVGAYESHGKTCKSNSFQPLMEFFISVCWVKVVKNRSVPFQYLIIIHKGVRVDRQRSPDRMGRGGYFYPNLGGDMPMSPLNPYPVPD